MKIQLSLHRLAACAVESPIACDVPKEARLPGQGAAFDKSASRKPRVSGQALSPVGRFKNCCFRSILCSFCNTRFFKEEVLLGGLMSLLSATARVFDPSCAPPPLEFSQRLDAS
jgi:hypothetical protein